MNIKNKKYFLIISAVALAVSCSAPKKVVAPVVKIIPERTFPLANTGPDDAFFESLFEAEPGIFDKTNGNVQIIYTEIKRNGGKQEFTNHYFNKGGVGYFYPASSIKFPLAILALQKINELKNKNIYRNTTMLTGYAYSGQTEVYNDPNTPAGKPSVEQYIKRALLVNDNDACNRLYEFLGQDYINTELKKHGYGDVEILHRLGVKLTEDENRHTNPVTFYDSLNKPFYNQPAQYNKAEYTPRNDVSGKGYKEGDKLVKQPMNMSEKNRISLESLHKMLVSFFYPDAFADVTGFNITENDRSFLLKWLGQDPGESVYPSYPAENYNGYGKYIYFGGENYRGKNIRSFNTSGLGYGQMTDAALIKDAAKNIEYMVSATIYCNSDGILNDDKYDYSTIGMPFLKKLGKVVYDHEVKKK